MRKLILLLASGIIYFSVFAQNPATVFTIPNKHIDLLCGTHCTNINVQVAHIKQTSTYLAQSARYLPYAYASPTGTEMTEFYSSTGDDRWSQAIPFPFAFSFCFYGINYPSLLLGSNAGITFDVSKATQSSGYVISSGIPSSNYAPSMIFGPWHDIDPRTEVTSTPIQRKVEWRVEGVAPYRRFIASYYKVNYFGSCTTITATHQTVLYENTGVIEVYIQDKPYCTDWNGGLAILGVQDQSMTKAVSFPGKNAAVWGSSNMDSCFRFLPSGGATMFKRAQLLVNNVVVATNTTDTSTTSPGLLNLNFPNVCPTHDSTAYLVKVTYGSCSNPALEVSFTDTVFVKMNSITASAIKVDATCFTNGSIKVAGTGGVAPLQYSINGGAFQSADSFPNLTPGTYNIITRDASSCSVTNGPITVALLGSVTAAAGNDTTLCAGNSFTRGVTTNATSYNWSPAGGVSNPTIANPVFAPQATTVYTVTASSLNCTAQASFKATINTSATANAGPDGVILSGDLFTLQGSGSGGAYSWSPPAGLSASNVSGPVASPSQTTTYILKVVTPQGCVATDSMLLTVLPYCIKPMQAFTPNGDGINDYWLVTTSTGCLDKAKAEVYNRYGSKVFESNDYKNDWNGTYNGKPLPDGTYYYVITFRLINGKDQFLKGNLTIIR